MVSGDSVVVFSVFIFVLRCIATAKRRGDLTSTRVTQRLAIKNLRLGPQSSLQIFNLAKQVSRHVWQVRAGRALPGYLTSMAARTAPQPPHLRCGPRTAPNAATARAQRGGGPYTMYASEGPQPPHLPRTCGAAFPYFPHRTYRPYGPYRPYRPPSPFPLPAKFPPPALPELHSLLHTY